MGKQKIEHIVNKLKVYGNEQGEVQIEMSEQISGLKTSVIIGMHQNEEFRDIILHCADLYKRLDKDVLNNLYGKN
jgi:hypothetical protein